MGVSVRCVCVGSYNIFFNSAHELVVMIIHVLLYKLNSLVCDHCYHRRSQWWLPYRSVCLLQEKR